MEYMRHDASRGVEGGMYRVLLNIFFFPGQSILSRRGDSAWIIVNSAVEMLLVWGIG
jgi:hypothetical protein